MLRFARSLGTSSLRRHLAVALVTLGLAALVGCEAGGLAAMPGADDETATPGDRGAEGDVCYENTLGDCVVATDGCDPDDISGSVVDRCASCAVSGGAVEVCGPARTARCFDIELSEPCQRCVTDDGDVLYDDCDASAEDLGDLTCEPVRYDSDDDTTCQVCRDANGDVVRESCRPNVAECRDVLRNGQECLECVDAFGQLAYRECARPDLDPSVCEVYEGVGGRCVDCYGAANELLSHECTMGIGLDGGAGAPMDSSAYCDVVTDPSGRSCERCYSMSGGLVSESCSDDVAAGPGRCEELVFSQQRCSLCVDASGQETSTQCYATDASCASPDCAPPACTNRYLDDGTLCRTCPAPGGATETRCMSGGALVCSTGQEFSEAPPPDDSGESDVVSEVCTVCTVDGAEEYRACTTDGTVPPQPVCSPETTAEGVSCEVCVDPNSGEAVYTSCPTPQPGSEPSPPPAPEGCEEHNGVPLTSEGGQQLYLPADDADAATSPAAIVSCSYCSTSGAGSDPDNTGTCLLQHECTTAEMNADVCGTRVRVAFDPLQCAVPPWTELSGVSALVAAMSWLLEHHDVVVYAAFDEAVPEGVTGTCEACDCPRGDRYVFEVSTADAERMDTLGVGFYRP